MADISLIQDDAADDSDEGIFEKRDESFEERPKDDSRSPLLRIKKYAESKNVLDRQVVPTLLVELFKKAPPDVLLQDLPQIMEIVVRMTRGDTFIRSDLLDEIPNIAATAMKCANRVPKLNQFISEYLLPIVVQNLGDSDNQVRKSAHSSLFCLLEKNLITRQQAEIQVCPTVLGLSDTDTFMDHHTGRIMLMSRLAPVLGPEVTERVLLDRFSKLCADTEFLVRKACASHFGDFCAVVGRDAYNDVLLPAYITLCSDEVWGVRKACAEIIVCISCACSSQKRQTHLAPVFEKLLQDQNRWVRMAAFRTLGPFISTFADPTITRLTYNSVGALVLLNKDGAEFGMSPIYSDLSDFIFNPVELVVCDSERNNLVVGIKDDAPNVFGDVNISLSEIFAVYEENVKPNDNENIQQNYLPEKEQLNNEDDKIVNKTAAENNTSDTTLSSIENLEQFNSYNYWYVSPEMTLDPSLVVKETVPLQNTSSSSLSGSPKHNGDVKNIQNETTPSILSQIETVFNSSTPLETELQGFKHGRAKQLEVIKKTEKQKETISEVVPQVLIYHFVSMTSTTLAEQTDSEMAYHCAYSLPAVVLTLGSKNWHLIQNTVEVLAANMQYKVRRTVANGLHELAMILGPEIATNSLTPIFEGFIKDLDEVRIGVLKHLAHFLRLMSPAKRIIYLPRLESFLHTDNEANWRFRQEFAEQLLLAVSLFRHADASKHISSLAQALLCDKVAAVREVALLLVTELVRHISSDQARTSRLLVKFAEQFAHSKSWKFRQSFALLCSELLMSRALLAEQFASELMPHLLDLSWDPVPNVRLVVARTVAQHILTNEYFCDVSNSHYDSLQSVLRRLQSDKDSDVRQFAVIQKVTNDQ
ncbi:hypothetical protein FQA39_LY06557 [Lamprigera yunnana]|nr:hypothetical protein FQA39_LY06557 [Lamprigera yunnana]